jgi:hypothetical protein
MKIIVTQTDLQQAIVAHLAQFNIHVSAEQLSIDLDDIEINLNPEDTGSNTVRTEGSTNGIKRRQRRSKEQIEADAKAESNVGYATPEAQAISEAAPVTTFVAPVAVDPFADVAVAAPSTQPLSEDSLDDEAELVEATPFIETRTKAEPISIFG